MVDRVITKFTDSPAVQLSSAIVALAILLGGVSYLTDLNSRATANEKEISTLRTEAVAGLAEIRTKQDSYNASVQTIMIQMAEIKGQIQNLNGQGHKR